MLPAKLTSHKRDFTVLGGGREGGGGILLKSLWMLLGSMRVVVYLKVQVCHRLPIVCVCVLG